MLLAPLFVFFSLSPFAGQQRRELHLAVAEVEPMRGAWPRNINLDPSGKWLLAAGAQSNTVAVFAIDPDTGALVFQNNSIVNVPGPICVLFVP